MLVAECRWLRAAPPSLAGRLLRLLGIALAAVDQGTVFGLRRLFSRVVEKTPIEAFVVAAAV